MRTVEEIFSNSYHVGERYDRFKILVVTEGGPDFSASRKVNTIAFREHMHGRFQRIIDAFEEAAKELNLPLGRIDRAEFFACYNYYWYNTCRSEIPSGEKINPEIYLSRLVEILNAGLVLSTGVGDERFRRNSDFLDVAEIFERRLELPIFIGYNEDFKKIFKIYLKNYRSGIDEAFDRIAEQIAKGKSPLDVLDEIGNGANASGTSRGGGFNTYPHGTPSDFHPELLVVCEDPMNLAEWAHGFFSHPHFHDWYANGAFNYIEWWCRRTQDIFPKRRVKLLSDKWTTEAYKRYENLFRRFAEKHGVKFEFYLYTLGAIPTEIHLPF